MEEVIGSLLLSFCFGAALGYIPLQIWAAVSCRGGWRWAALAPLVLMVPVFGYTVYALAQESNLWPIVWLFVSPLPAAYLTIVIVSYYLAARRAQPVNMPRPTA